MKTTLSSLLALSLITLAAPIKVGWDAMHGMDGFRIYQGTAVLAEIGGAANTAVIDIPDGEVTITATAFNVRGESDKSEPLVIPARPQKVKMFLVTIEGQLTITIKPAPEAE